MAKMTGERPSFTPELEAGGESEARLLRELLKRSYAEREQERTRIAREIHDVVGQQLTTLKLEVWLAENRTGNVADPAVRDAISEKLALTAKLIDDTAETVRMISADLRPSLLDHVGLGAALEQAARQYQKRSGVRCEVSAPSERFELDGETATAVFRISQEMLGNVARHAQAKTARVELRVGARELSLTVIDDGKELTAQELDGTTELGILGMRERARALNGHVELSNVSTGGTMVRVTVPLAAP